MAEAPKATGAAEGTLDVNCCCCCWPDGFEVEPNGKFDVDVDVPKEVPVEGAEKDDVAPNPELFADPNGAEFPVEPKPPEMFAEVDAELLPKGFMIFGDAPNVVVVVLVVDCCGAVPKDPELKPPELPPPPPNPLLICG